MNNLEKILRLGVESYPDDWSVRKQLLDYLLAEKREEEAAEALLRDGRLPEVRGEAAEELWKVLESLPASQASGLVSESLEEDSANAGAHYFAAGLSMREGRAKETAFHYRLASALDPTIPGKRIEEWLNRGAGVPASDPPPDAGGLELEEKVEEKAREIAAQEADIEETPCTAPVMDPPPPRPEIVYSEPAAEELRYTPREELAPEDEDILVLDPEEAGEYLVARETEFPILPYMDLHTEARGGPPVAASAPAGAGLRMTSAVLATAGAHAALGLVFAFFFAFRMPEEPPPLVTVAPPAAPKAAAAPPKTVVREATLKPPAPASAAMPMPPILTTSAFSPVSLPAAEAALPAQSPADVLGTMPGAASFASAALGEGPAGGAGSLFGTEISGENLGVLLDISKSMYRYLPAVLAEIDKGFPDAVLILYHGCGMNKPPAGADRRSYRLNNRAFRKDKIYSELSKDNKPLLETLKKRRNVYFVRSQGAKYAQMAFEKLSREGLDAVYWFADFQDPVSVDVLQDAAKEFQRKKTAVFLQHAGRSSRNLGAIEEHLIKPTGGKTISRKLD